MLNQMRRFLKDQSGAAAIEYGLITSGISYRLQNSMNRHIYYRRMRSMGELFSEFEV